MKQLLHISGGFNVKESLPCLPPKLHVNPYMSSAVPTANFRIRAMGRIWDISMSALVCQVTIILLIAIEFANANNYDYAPSEEGCV